MSLFQEPFERRSSRRRRRVGKLFLAVGLVLTAAIMVMPAPYVIERPGSATNTLGSVNSAEIISIDSKTYPTTGRLNMLTVELLGSPVMTPSWFEIAKAWIDPAEIVIPLDEAFPDNQSETESDRENQIMMDTSQQDAVAAALGGLGYKVDRALAITQIFKSTPAAGVLKVGDLLVAINGDAIQNVDQIRSLVKASHGKEMTITVLRGNSAERLDLKVTPYKDGSTYRLGIYTGTRYKFPFDVKFDLPGVGGPSAGMMFALAVTDKLTPGSMTGGQNISGTGTIDADGNVGPIGGIRQKMYAALRAGSKVMLAPGENCSEVIGNVPAGLVVLKVDTLAEAKYDLAALASGTEPTKLPQCTK